MILKSPPSALRAKRPALAAERSGAAGFASEASDEQNVRWRDRMSNWGSGRKPRFDNRSPSYEEPFRERSERARSLPPEYAKTFARFVSDLMERDEGAAYYAYDFWTTAVWGNDFAQIARRLQRACQFATCDVVPTLNRSSLNRIPPQVCVAAIVLPAQKRDGVPHVCTGSSGSPLVREAPACA